MPKQKTGKSNGQKTTRCSCQKENKTQRKKTALPQCRLLLTPLSQTCTPALKPNRPLLSKSRATKQICSMFHHPFLCFNFNHLIFNGKSSWLIKSFVEKVPETSKDHASESIHTVHKLYSCGYRCLDVEHNQRAMLELSAMQPNYLWAFVRSAVLSFI